MCVRWRLLALLLVGLLAACSDGVDVSTGELASDDDTPAVADDSGPAEEPQPTPVVAPVVPIAEVTADDVTRTCGNLSLIHI